MDAPPAPLKEQSRPELIMSLDDFVDPAELSALTRRHLKEAFRAVASIQKRVATELQFGVI